MPGKARSLSGGAMATTDDPAFVFEPIRVSCSEHGITRWSRDPASKDRFLFRVTDGGAYAPAMTAALTAVLRSLP